MYYKFKVDLDMVIEKGKNGGFECLKEGYSIDASMIKKATASEFEKVELLGRSLSFIALEDKENKNYHISCGDCFVTKEGDAVMYIGRAESKFVTDENDNLLDSLLLKDGLSYMKENNLCSFLNHI